MPKQIPECPPEPSCRKPSKECREYQIELVTPLFGGGVEAGEADSTFPIRGTSIRGQLRTWWRLVYGYSLGSTMWQREEELFGSTEFPSPLTVSVLDQPQLEMVEANYGDRFGPIAYALFAAVENNQRVAKEGCRFRLQLSWDTQEGLNRRRSVQNEQRKIERKQLLPPTIEDISSEIKGALNAWVTYGGIGARTRRGCGAVYCETVTRLNPTVIPGKILLGVAQANALEAWKASVKAYQEFRQTPRGNRHSKTIQTKKGPKTIQVPGRSHWPEADSIRHITGCSLKPQAGNTGNVPVDEDPHDHSTPVVPSELLPAFPKGVLGLPINFHFADGPGKHANGNSRKDPQDVQLVALIADGSGKPQRVDRMSSPVITRPLWIDGKWYPAVIILDQRSSKGLQFRLEGKKARAGGGDISHDIAVDQVVNPSLGVLRPMRGKSSAVDALVDFLSSNGFKEVVR